MEPTHVRCSDQIRVEARFRRAVYTKVPTITMVDVHCRSVHAPPTEWDTSASENRVAPQTKTPRRAARRLERKTRLELLLIIC